MPEIRVTARGLLPSIALVGGLVLLPYLLAGSLSQSEAEATATGFYRRRAVMSILDSNSGSDPSQRRQIEAELERSQAITLSSVRVRRSLVVPPFSKRTAFLIEYRIASEPEPAYLRVSGASVRETSSFWWNVRL